MSYRSNTSRRKRPLPMRAAQFCMGIAVFVSLSMNVAAKQLEVRSTLVAEAPETWAPRFTTISPDGRRVALIALQPTERTGRVVVDGRAGPAYDDFLRPKFSADSRRVVYAGKRGNSWIPVVDGVEGPA